VNYARGCASRRAQQDVSPDLLDALSRIAAEAMRAGDVVHSLKRVVRKEPPREVLLDPALVVHEAVQLIRSDASNRGITVRVDAPRGLHTVWGDRIQLQQVVLNLLRNAIEAIPQMPGMIDVHVRPEGGALAVSVSDSGVGLPPTLGDEIFTPFVTTKTNGLGMGLAISRTIVEAHGGRLWSEPHPGGGTTFSFTVPLGTPRTSA